MKAIVYIEIPVEIELNYSPGEPQTHWDPGCPEEFEIMSYNDKQAAIEVQNAIDCLDDEEIDCAGIESLERYTMDARLP